MHRAARITASLLVAVFIVALWATSTTFAGTATPLHVEGTPAQIGQTLGTQQARAITTLHPQFVAIAQAVAGQDKATLYARAHQIEKYIDKDHLDEMRAIAAASGLTYDDVLFLNCFYSITSRHTMACRQIAAWGGATTDGRLLHARNLDWVDYPGSPLDKHHLILDITPPPGKGFRHVLLTWPGLMGSVTGTNERGITVGFNQLMEGDRVDRLAEPTFFTLRRVLEQADTLDKAIAIIEKAKPLDDGSILISDAAQKTAAVVEIIDGTVGVRKPAAPPANGTMIGNANHATKEAGMDKLPGVRTWDCDWPTCTTAQRLKTKIDVKQAERIMADPSVMQGRINMLCAVFDPTNKKLYLSVRSANAAAGPFTEYSLFTDPKGP